MTKMTHVGLDVHKDSIAVAKLRPERAGWGQPGEV
jgi:hypothetical protein